MRISVTVGDKGTYSSDRGPSSSALIEHVNFAAQVAVEALHVPLGLSAIGMDGTGAT